MSTVAIQSAAFSPVHVSNRISIRTWVRDHVVALNIISLAILGLLVVSYIVQVNATISKGYEIRDLETQVHELSLLNQNLELETRKAQSLNDVAESVQMLGFIKAEMPNYIDGTKPTFAMAQ
ncbi:hypothetical protein HQ487_05100 [Candidatus Uhrbacteria bacterium]|nr:hypothetical protein [Candidatus Uhrbacteria bacterium]